MEKNPERSMLGQAELWAVVVAELQQVHESDLLGHRWEPETACAVGTHAGKELRVCTVVISGHQTNIPTAKES